MKVLLTTFSPIFISLRKMTDYIRGSISKYEKNVANVPEIFGRLIIALSGICGDQEIAKNISLRDVDKILMSIYKKRQEPHRRDYVRKFINKNRSFLINFIQKKNLRPTRNENCE